MRGSLSKGGINALFRRRQTLRTAFFVVSWVLSEGDLPRVGFAFARNQGKSHIRHLFKRRLRALVQIELAGCGVDLFITTGKSLASLSKTAWLRERGAIKRFCHEKIQRALHHSDQVL